MIYSLISTELKCVPISGVYPIIILALNDSTYDLLFCSAAFLIVVTGLDSDICSRSLVGFRYLIPSVSTEVSLPV
jgi:hypothetical protein